MRSCPGYIHISPPLHTEYHLSVGGRGGGEQAVRGTFLKISVTRAVSVCVRACSFYSSKCMHLDETTYKNHLPSGHHLWAVSEYRVLKRSIYLSLYLFTCFSEQFSLFAGLVLILPWRFLVCVGGIKTFSEMVFIKLPTVDKNNKPSQLFTSWHLLVSSCFCSDIWEFHASDHCSAGRHPADCRGAGNHAVCLP